MNRDEILSMPEGREMDVLIFDRVFGKTAHIISENDEWEFTGDRDWLSTGQAYFIDKEDNGNAYELLRYSSNVFAAWKVVEEMCKRKYRYEIGGNFAGLGNNYAAFDDQDWADRNPLYKSYGVDVPLAICRAALLAVMED
jgi:hypothetical protein